MGKRWTTMTLLLAAAIPAAALAQAVTPAISRALADSSRPAADRVRDEARKAGPLLAFAGVKPGDKVADFIMGSGYWTRILSGVVGPKGKVYAYQPAQFIQFRAAYGTEQEAAVAGRANVAALRMGLGEVAFPEPLDAIVTVQNYHDLHLSVMPAGFAAAINKRLFQALKPGGVLLVVDHASNPDPDFTSPQAIHRIDPAAARKEIEAAGFVFGGESQLLHTDADPRTASVFDAGIKGRTDQFVYRFRKPR